MIYEKYKLEILRYSMDLEQRVLDFNLLCSANVQGDKLRIGMREIDSNDPQNIYKQVKFASKKYCGQSAIYRNKLQSDEFICVIPWRYSYYLHCYSKTRSVIYISKRM